MLFRCDVVGYSESRGRAKIQVTHQLRKGSKYFVTGASKSSHSLVTLTLIRGMPACATTRGTPHSPKGSLVFIVIFVKLSDFFENISSYEHFLVKRSVVDTGSPSGHIGRSPGAIRALWHVRALWRVASPQTFFRREWIRRFPWFQYERPFLVRTYR